jgi:hypothetical protein
MRALLALLVAVASTAICSCSMMPPPIPVVGSSERVAELAGTWSGDYSSEATGATTAGEWSVRRKRVSQADGTAKP